MNRRRFLLTMGSSLAWVGARALDGDSLPRAASGTGLVYKDDFVRHEIAPDHPERPARAIAFRDELHASGLAQRVRAVEPLTDVLPQLALIHTGKHIEAIRASYPVTHEVACIGVGGLLASIREVCEGRLKNAFCASRPPGHHAINTGREEGFCYYSNIAIAARYAQRTFGLERILIVDWDYHHGNGTEAFFYTDPSVLFFSTHDWHAYPGTGDPARRGEGAGYGFNINVHLPCGSTDDDILRAFREQLLPAADKFRPELILISAGFDSRVDDLLGCFAVTDAGFVELTRVVMDLADRHCGGRVVSMLEGGYNLYGLASAMCAHLRTLLEA